MGDIHSLLDFLLAAYTERNPVDSKAIRLAAELAQISV